MPEEKKPEKIIEGLKRLRVLEKRCHDTATDIQEYASVVSTEIPRFETKEKQTAKVASLVQSVESMEREMRGLKLQIDRTNMSVKVTIQGKEYSLADLLYIRRKTKNLVSLAYNALNLHEAESRMSRLSMRARENEKTPTAMAMFNEDDKRKKQRAWQDLLDEIESRLEVINATTNMVD